MRDEVSELDDVPSVGIHERLIPHGLAIVPDLHNVREGDGTILLRNIFDLGRMLVIRSPELAFSLGDRIGGGDGGRGRGDVGCGSEKLAKWCETRMAGGDAQGHLNHLASNSSTCNN